MAENAESSNGVLMELEKDAAMKGGLRDDVDDLGVIDNLEALTIKDDDLKENDQECASQKNLSDQESNHVAAESVQAPMTKYSDLVPEASNLRPEEMIDQWPMVVYLATLLENLPRAADETAAMKEIRSLTINSSSFIPEFFRVKEGAINQLLNPNSIQRSYSNACMQEDLSAIVFTIFSHMHSRGSNIVAAEYPGAVPFLIESLRAESSKTRSNVASSLCILSTLESNKGELGALIGPLIWQIEAETDVVALYFASEALFIVCRMVENRARAVSEGAVVAAMGKILSHYRVAVGELNLHLLAMLSSHEWTMVAETEACRVLHCVFEILEQKGGVCAINKECEEHCVVILHKLCHDDLIDTRKVENGRQTLERIASGGRTEPARKKASELLLKLR